MSGYLKVCLAVAGKWVNQTEDNLDVTRPAVVGSVPIADESMLHRTAAASLDGIEKWRLHASRERALATLRAADLLEERIKEIGVALTLDQSKPLDEATAECAITAEFVRWSSEEACRVHACAISGEGWIRHLSTTELVGPVVAVSPWNVPALAAGQSATAALATGCSVGSAERLGEPRSMSWH